MTQNCVYPTMTKIENVINAEVAFEMISAYVTPAPETE